MDEVLEVILMVVFMFIGLMVIVALLVFVLNPYFWQGLRNSKFIDELKRTEPTDLIKP